VNLLKAWLGGTGLLLGALAIYNFVPVLIPLFVLVLFLACLTAVVVRLAHWLVARLNLRRPGG
jgi:hypothetical protein